jgi:glycosyltransferase involved in cell wall biosynthesis
VSIPRYAVILTHNRPEMLDDTVAAIRPQCDTMLVIDNASDPPVPEDKWLDVNVHYVARQPPNLAMLWNYALRQITVWAGNLGQDRWDVALLCDDLAIPPDWYDRVSNALRSNNASAASAHQVYDAVAPIVHVRPTNDIMNRMHGAAFILPGEKGMRADETFHWWWCDTDIDWQARHADGTVIAAGPPVVNRLPNAWTNAKPELGAQAGRDAERFAEKWGARPW